MRGMEKVTGEWALLVLAFNIRKIVRKFTRLTQGIGKHWILMRLGVSIQRRIVFEKVMDRLLVQDGGNASSLK